MPAATDDWKRVLTRLERTLTHLERSGAQWLTVAPAAELGAALRAAREAQARPEAPVAPAAVPERPAAGTARPPAQPPRVPRAGGGVSPAPDPEGQAPAPEPTAPAATAAVPPAQPAALESIETLESLRFQYRDCRRCKLADTRNRLVFGVGPGRPRIVFVGEGPGAEEDQQGLPFVGRAGALLSGLIEAMGLVRADVYITNVVKCRPPGNRNPEPDEVGACRPILQRQLELLAPRLIVTLGNVPLKLLKPDAAGITRERGRTFPYGQWTVLPTFHPSYLLRNRSALGTCWADFRKALELAYPEP